MQAALGFFSEDAEWTLAPGTFSGKDGIRRYLEWNMRTSPKATYRLTGIGVLTAGDVAVREAEVEQVLAAALFARDPAALGVHVLASLGDGSAVGRRVGGYCFPGSSSQSRTRTTPRCFALQVLSPGAPERRCEALSVPIEHEPLERVR